MKKILITTLLALIFTGCETENDVVESGGVILATFAGNLEINSKSSLDSAITDGSYVNSIGGNLSINTGGSTGITVADVKKISSQIQSVDGNVTINTPDGSLDLTQLSSVGGNYSIEGSDANDDNLLTVDGDITLNYEGDYDMPNLTSVGNILLTPVVTSSASKKRGGIVSFTNVAECGFLGVGVNAVTAGLSGRIDFTNLVAGSISFGPGIPLTDLIAPDALSISILNPSPVASLSINAPNALDLSVATTAVNGSFAVTAGVSGTFTANNLTNISGNASITAGTFTANACTSVGGNLSISSNDATMTSLGTVVGNLNVTGTVSNTTAGSANFANLTNVGGELSIDAEEVNQNTGQPHNSGGNSQTHNSGGNG